MKQKFKINKTVEVIKKRALILVARSYKNKKQFKTAEIYYGKVLDKTSLRLRTSYHYEYADILHNNKKYDKALEHINYAIDSDKESHANYFVLRAEIYMKLKQMVNAEDDINYATELANTDAFAHYISGIVLILQNKWYQAEESLLIAQKLGHDTEYFFRRLGQASFAMEHFSKSAEAFEKAADMWSIDRRAITKSDLYYMAGLSKEKSGNFKVSQSFYKKALKYDTKHNSEVLGIGIFHELNEQYSLAIKAYSKMEAAEPLFRLALLYEKMGDKEQAITSYKNVLKVNQIESKYHFRLAICYEDTNNYEKAEIHYKQAIARNNDHDLQWYLKLLNVLDKLNNSEEYKQILNEANIVTDYINNVYQNGEEKMSVQARYNMFSHRLNPVKNTVLFESFTSSRISGNPFAIFKHMLQDNRFKDYTFIWTVNDETLIPERYKNLHNVIFVKRSSDLYHKYLSTASILINNATFPPFFILKDGQKYLNTWHGTPWKTLGSDIEMSKLDYGNVSRNFLQATHLSLPNQYTYDHQIEPAQVANIYLGEAAITGYPRIDLTYQAMRNQRSIKENLDIIDDKKIILYAPTWRGDRNFRSFDKNQLEIDLKKLSQINAHILFRGHHMAEDLLMDIDIPNVTVVPDYFDTNELLGVVDMLITDYSSVFFDFLVTDNPIIHYIYDYETYKTERGLYFGLEELPGNIVKSTQQLIESVQAYIQTTYEPTQKYIDAKSKFVYKDDGYVTKKVVDWVVFGENNVEIVSHKNTDKKKILFHGGGFKHNGITTAFINLVNAIDKQKYEITIIVSEGTGNSPERVEQLDKIQKGINILPRNGSIDLSDGGLFAKALNENSISTNKTNKILKRKYQQEYKRIFNHVEFDYVIDFDGYSPFYNQLLINNTNTEAKNIVIVHSDIYSEYINRFPAFNQTFEQYKYFDKVISVSKPTSELNKHNLSETFQIPKTNFDYIKNIQGPEAVLENSKLDLDNESGKELFSEDKTVFITIGRLSEEKDHNKLIRAFWNVQKSNPKTKLLILGDGPLKHRLLSVIEELGLENSVHLLGHKANPYPYLKYADCFVLSSNYEGQPVVLFEAMILNKPIIATDIVSNRDVLQDGYGELCENSIEGMTDAMNRFIVGELHSKAFNIEEYNQSAIEMFYEKVL